MRNKLTLLCLIGSVLTSFSYASQNLDSNYLFLGKHTNDIESVAISRIDGIIATGSWDNTIQLFSVDSSVNWIQSLEHHTGAVNSLSFSRNGKLLVSGGLDYKVVLWQIDEWSGEYAKDIELPSIHTASVTSVKVGSYNRTIYSAGADGQIMSYNIEKKTKRVIKTNKPINDIAISTNKRFIYCADQTAILKQYDLAGRIVREMEGHQDVINAVAYSLNSRFLVTGSSDKTAIIWDLAKHKPLHTLKGHGWKVTSVFITEDCKHVVTGSNDGSLKLWNLETGELIKDVKTKGNNIRSVALSFDNQWIVAAPNYRGEDVAEYGANLYASGLKKKAISKSRRRKSRTPEGWEPMGADTAVKKKSKSMNTLKKKSSTTNSSKKKKPAPTSKKVIKKTDEIEISEQND